MGLNITLDVGESIKIQDQIQLEYVGRAGRRVKLRFTADKHISIQRIKINEPEIVRKSQTEEPKQLA